MAEMADLAGAYGEIRKVLLASPSQGDSISSANTRHFCKIIGCAVETSDGKNYHADGYSLKSVKGVLEKIQNSKPPFTANLSPTLPKFRFEQKLLAWLRATDFAASRSVRDDLFRASARVKQSLSFAKVEWLDTPSSHLDYLASRLFDLAKSRDGSLHMLDSDQTQGLFFLGATESDFDPSTVNTFRLTFADLLPISNAEYMKHAINLVDNKVVEITRIEPDGKPRMSQREFLSFLVMSYKLGQSQDQSKAAMPMFDQMKGTELDDFLIKCQIELLNTMIEVSERLLTQHMLRLHYLFFRKLLSGNLGRTVFDVDYGAVFVNLADQSRYWTIAATPIQRRVDGADRLISNLIIDEFHAKLATRRT